MDVFAVNKTNHGGEELLLCIDIDGNSGYESDVEEILEDSNPGDVICIIPLILNILFR